MSTRVPCKPARSKRVRHDRGVSEERREENGKMEVSVVYVNERADSLGDQGSGSQDHVLQSGILFHRDILVQKGILRAAAVCLVLLCFLLLVVIIIGMAVHYNSVNNQLQANYNNVTMDRNQLQTSYNNLTSESSRLQTHYDNMTLERNHFHTRLKNLTLEKNLLQSEVTEFKRQTADKSCPSGWKKFGCSCYYRSTEKQTWEESREQCLKTGADLAIINSKEEQKFVKGLTHGDGASWIGLKRIEGSWTWVDGTPPTTQYWASGYPFNDEDRNCTYYWHRTGGWYNVLCSYVRAWPSICEK